MPFPTIVCVHTHVCVCLQQMPVLICLRVWYINMYLYGPKQKSNYVCAEVRVGDKWFLCVMGAFLLMICLLCVQFIYFFVSFCRAHCVLDLAGLMCHRNVYYYYCYTYHYTIGGS